jgi:glucan phosphoethanolaminetransferase (alkaline phosphatase superfamily)
MSHIVDLWSRRWSEHNSPYQLESIKEPMNTLSAFIMCLYVVKTIYNEMITNTRILNNRLSNTNQKPTSRLEIVKRYCYGYTFRILMKAMLVLNLVSSALSHSTYNRYAIIYDGGSIVILMATYMVKEGRYLQSVYLVTLYMFSDVAAYLMGFVSIISILSTTFIAKDKKGHYCQMNVMLMVIALTLWIYDQIFLEQWYVYGHAIFHLLSVYSINNLIDIYC